MRGVREREKMVDSLEPPFLLSRSRFRVKSSLRWMTVAVGLCAREGGVRGQPLPRLERRTGKTARVTLTVRRSSISIPSYTN